MDTLTINFGTNDIVTPDGKTITVTIYRDSVDFWDHIAAGHMACWHLRYKMGTEQPRVPPDEWMKSMAGLDDLEYRIEEALWRVQAWGDEWTAAIEHIRKQRIKKAIERMMEDNVFLPLYLYDHGSFAMNTTGFSHMDFHGWDWGQVGWAYLTSEEIESEFGGDREAAEKYLQSVVKEYDAYLRGEMYGFSIEADGNIVDACSLFTDLDWMVELINDALKEFGVRVEI